MFHAVWELERFQTAKVTVKVIQGYWQWCYSIGHIQFPISVPLQLCLSCTVNKILSLISQNVKRSRDITHPFQDLYIMHALVLLCLCVSTSKRNLKCPASPFPKTWLGQNLKNKSCDPGGAPFKVVILKLRYGIVYLFTKFDNPSFSRSRDVIG